MSSNPFDVSSRLTTQPNLDPEALSDLLRCGYVTGTRTLIKGVESVPPATILRLSGTTHRKERYWTYGYAPEPMAEDLALEELAETFKAAVGRCAAVLNQTQATPTLTLSGGLDSRVLAAPVFAGRLANSRSRFLWSAQQS